LTSALVGGEWSVSLPDRFILIKISNPNQAGTLNQYTNTKRKLLKPNSSMWGNRVCESKELAPNYIEINANIATRIPQKQAIKYSMNKGKGKAIPVTGRGGP
jgi:hypothetical protein